MEAADAGALPQFPTLHTEGDSVHVPDYGLGTVVSCDGTNCVISLQAWEQDGETIALHSSLRPPVRGPEQKT